MPTNLTLRPRRSNSQTVKKSHIRSRAWASDNLRYLNLPWPLARGLLGLPHLATFAATNGPKPTSHTQPCSRWAQDADPFKIANQARTVTSAAAVRLSYRHNCASRLASRRAIAYGSDGQLRGQCSSIIAQCLNLEREFHHTGSKPCILGFEPLKQSLIARTRPIKLDWVRIQL